MDSGGFCLLCGKRLKSGTLENKKKNRISSEVL